MELWNVKVDCTLMKQKENFGEKIKLWNIVL